MRMTKVAMVMERREIRVVRGFASVDVGVGIVRATQPLRRREGYRR